MRINRKLHGGLAARLFLAILCAVGGLSLQLFSTTAGAQVTTNEEIIVFTRGGNIWKMKPDGSNQTLVGEPFLYGADPQLSPDATRIAFTCGTELWDICVMNTDGGNLQTLTDTRADGKPVWSPDGTRIAFNSTREGAPRVYTMNADGSNEQPLAINDPSLTDASGPAWSPDGTGIAFVGSNEQGTDIYVANVDGTGAPARLTFDGGLKNNLAWSPNGSQIAFDTFDAVRVVNVASGAVVTLTSAGDENEQPVYSPDGSRIAFYRKTFIRDEEGTIVGSEDGIYVMQADGTGVVSLNAPGGYAPDWRSLQATPPPPAKTPAERMSDLISLVRSFNLHHGTANSLTVKLRAALEAIEAGDTATACARLSDFINQTRAQSGKKLTREQATQLIGEADAIRTLLGCS